MDTNQPTPPPPTSLFQLNIDTNAHQTLRSAASWSKVLGIVSVILGILFFILGILMQSAIKRNAGFGENASMMGNVGMAVYIIFGLVMVISAIFSMNFSNKINMALRSNDQYSLTAGLAAVRNYFAFWAILCIIFLLLFLLTIIQLASK